MSLRSDEKTFAAGLAQLPQEAQALNQAGVTRVGTAVSSSSDTLNYLENFKQTSRRLREPRNDSRPLLREVGVIAMLGLPLLVIVVALVDSWMYARFALFSLPGAVLLMAGGIDCLWHKKRLAALPLFDDTLRTGESKLSGVLR